MKDKIKVDSEELLDLIGSIDLMVGDWRFTREIILMFLDEYIISGCEDPEGVKEIVNRVESLKAKRYVESVEG